MIKPNDLEKMELEDADFEKLEEDIDNSIKSFHGWYPWEEEIIRGEYPVSVRNAIGKKYKKSGWKHVYHQTSSENGERPGLTCFKFSSIPLADEHTMTYFIEVV